MNSHSNSSSSCIERRSALRNLDAFLSFDFNSGSRLKVSDTHIYGTAVEVLQSYRKSDLSWKMRLLSRWTRSDGFRRVCHRILKEIPIWKEALSNDEGQLLKLERHLAILERTAMIYDSSVSKKRADWVNINFTSPMKRLLKVQIHYPEMLGGNAMHTMTRDVPYDRLTSKEDLVKLMDLALDQPIPLKFMADKKWDSPAKALQTLDVIPSHVFKTTLKNPLAPKNPAQEPVFPMMQTVDVTFDEVDWSSLSLGLYTKGQNETMQRIYQEGIADGKKIGYSEAMASITAVFNKAKC